MTTTPPPERLVVVAPNWLGDAVMALPLLADLRRAWPETHLTVAARPAVAPLFTMVPGVRDVVQLQDRGRRAFTSWRYDAEQLAGGGFDAALLLPNSFLSAWLVSQARIPQRWGIARDLRGWLLTRAVPRPRRYGHQAEYYQALGAPLGIPTRDSFAQLTVDERHHQRARDLLRHAGLTSDDRYIVFAPGAAYGRAKQWLPERFAELSMLLTEKSIRTVLVGTSSDAGVCAEISGSASPVNLSGQTDLPTLAAVMALSEGVVSNDSGAMHLASAVGARLVAIFGPTNDSKTSPLRANATAPLPTIVSTNVWCRPCMLRECPIDHRCMTRISARQVLDALETRAARS
jgi:heptosyltransferase II